MEKINIYEYLTEIIITLTIIYMSLEVYLY